MKTKMLFLVLVISICSCEKTRDESTCESDGIKIKGQVKEIVKTIFKGCEEVNSQMVLQSSFDSPDFVYIFNGKTLTYEGFSTSLTAIYDKMLNQEVTIIDEKYAVLDNMTVLYTANCTFLENYKDGHNFLADPAVMLFIFKKIDDSWRWIYGVESYGQ
jgi:hypothetical protein